MQINYHKLQQQCIDLGIVKVSDVDGSHTFNASMSKLYLLVQMNMPKDVPTTQAVSGANNRSRQ